MGVNDIQVTGADAQNYVWNDSTSTSATITKAYLDVTAHAADKVYDGSREASVTLGDNRVAGDQLVITNAGAEFDTKNAGTNKNVTVNGVMVSGADAGNYDWDVQQITSAEISKADLRVAGNHAIKNAGDQDPALAWSILAGTLYGSDTLNGVLLRTAGEGAGIYEIGQGTLSAGGNYNVIYTPGTLEITKSPVTDTTVTDAAVASIGRITREVNGTGTAKASVVDNSGYRLINLGIKLPEDISLLRDENNDS